MLLTKAPKKGLRIDLSMRYNALNGEYLPQKASACSAVNTTRRLTQPTEWTEDWAGMDFIIPDLSRPGGIPIGAFCVCRAGLRAECPSYIGGTMLTITQPHIMTVSNMLEVLAGFRQEWEQVAEGESLVEVKASVGLMLFDLATAFGLRTSEQVQVLGSALYEELQGILLVIPENGRGI